jgi:hypothetical protein
MCVYVQGDPSLFVKCVVQSESKVVCVFFFLGVSNVLLNVVCEGRRVQRGGAQPG